jgi:hypothetical protein
MKLLLLADSHGKELAPIILRQVGLQEPPFAFEQFHVIRGRSIEVIRGEYRRQLAAIRVFDPDHVIIHAGHNNMVKHAVYNRSPLFITAVVHLLLEFVVELRATFPTIKIFISTLMPRKSSRNMSNLEASQYNRLCKRFGQHLLSNEVSYSYSTILNRPFWLRISLAEPNKALLSPDGLHATDTGREVLVGLWLSALVARHPSLPASQ